MTKLFYSCPDKNQAKYVLKLGRIELSRFIKLITGHNGLFYFRSKIDPDISPICRFCLQDDETFYHLVTECPVHRDSRINIFKENIPLANTNTKWSVRDLLCFSDSRGIRDAIDGETALYLFGEDQNWFSDDDSETDGTQRRSKRPRRGGTPDPHERERSR